jgi:hypothetical protein
METLIALKNQFAFIAPFAPFIYAAGVIVGLSVIANIAGLFGNAQKIGR